MLPQVENEKLVIYDQIPHESKAILNKPELVTAECHPQHSKRIVAAFYGHAYDTKRATAACDGQPQLPQYIGQGAFDTHQSTYQEIGRGAFGAVRTFL